MVGGPGWPILPEFLAQEVGGDLFVVVFQPCPGVCLMQHSVSNAHPAPREAIPARLVEVLYETEGKLSRHLL